MRGGIRGLTCALFLLVGPLVLSGCLSGATEFETTKDIEPGHAAVTIWVNRPAGLDAFPVKELVGVPRFVAFVAGSNESKLELGPGYTDVATGWPTTWGQGNHSADQWPITAEKDWTERSSIWYEGQIPPGEYSVIRIEVMDVSMAYHSGGKAQAYVQGDRLSFAPANGEYFVVEEGDDLVLAMDSKIEEQGHGRFVIR